MAEIVTCEHPDASILLKKGTHMILLGTGGAFLRKWAWYGFDDE
jgi:hypothetical protein